MKTAYAKYRGKIELLIFFKPGSNRQQKCHRSYIYFIVRAPTTSSEHIYNSGGKETLSYHAKLTKSLSLMFLVTNEIFSTSQLTFLFFTSDLLKTPKPILE